jgi:GlpG protein
LWIWEFGRRIEASLGSLNLLGLYLASAVFSNSVQYFISGPSIFGGMSGVVYALMGFIWAGNFLRPNWMEPLPSAVMGFMLIWLLVGLVGALEILGAGAIANGAHLGGLIIGVLLGGLFAFLSRLDRP